MEEGADNCLIFNKSRNLNTIRKTNKNEGGRFMLPVQITIRGIPVSEALRLNIQKRAEKLNQFYKRISSCRVVLELSQKHKHQGKLYNARVDITVPGKEFVVTRKVNQDAYIAVRDAFNALERQLEEHSNKRHGWVKKHDNIMHGRVARLIAREGYGFIEGMDGHEYYFSLTNMSHPEFEKLTVGDTVEYVADHQGDGRLANHVIREKRFYEIA